MAPNPQLRRAAGTPRVPPEERSETPNPTPAEIQHDASAQVKLNGKTAKVKTVKRIRNRRTEDRPSRIATEKQKIGRNEEQSSCSRGSSVYPVRRTENSWKQATGNWEL